MYRGHMEGVWRSMKWLLGVWRGPIEWLPGAEGYRMVARCAEGANGVIARCVKGMWRGIEWVLGVWRGHMELFVSA